MGVPYECGCVMVRDPKALRRTFAVSASYLGRTEGWVTYDFPADYGGGKQARGFKGQKQVWFLLQMRCEETDLRLDLTDKPEFDGWRWVDYWHPLQEVVEFKRDVYRHALNELAPLLGMEPREPIRRNAIAVTGPRGAERSPAGAHVAASGVESTSPVR